MYPGSKCISNLHWYIHYLSPYFFSCFSQPAMMQHLKKRHLNIVTQTGFPLTSDPMRYLFGLGFQILYILHFQML